MAVAEMEHTHTLPRFPCTEIGLKRARLHDLGAWCFQLLGTGDFARCHRNGNSKT